MLCYLVQLLFDIHISTTVLRITYSFAHSGTTRTMIPMRCHLASFFQFYIIISRLFSVLRCNGFGIIIIIIIAPIVPDDYHVAQDVPFPFCLEWRAIISEPASWHGENRYGRTVDYCYYHIEIAIGCYFCRHMPCQRVAVPWWSAFSTSTFRR